MNHFPNLNHPPIKRGGLTRYDFEAQEEAGQPAEAATEVGADDVVMPYDGTQKPLGALITAACALVTAAVAVAGYYFKTVN
jgi:hypothetical protein